MKAPFLRGRVLPTVAASLLLTVLFASVAGAQVFNFSPGGFTAANVCATGCQILTNGSPSLPTVIPGGILRLNSAASNQHASAWYFSPQPMTTGFTTAFQFAISSNGGDGLAFVIQGDPAGTGALGFTGDGQDLAYGNDTFSSTPGPGHAILNSLAVEIDTYMNGDYGDPDSNHIAVQSCGSTPSALSPNSANHLYPCSNGQPALLKLASPSVSMSDGQTHTLTVNYLPPGSCTTGCNNFSVYLDSALVLQTTVDLAHQLVLDGNGAAFVGFTSSTGAAVENNDIVSWSFSQLPLAPITIVQPLQTADTTFNFTPTLSAGIDYSNSGVDPSGVFMQSTIQAITDAQFTGLVNNTPFQGSTCLYQDLGNGTFACVTTTDLCTTSTNRIPAGQNCPKTDATPLFIGATSVFHAKSAQKPITAPAYLMGKDTALDCPPGSDNGCKGLINIFTSIVGDPTVSGKTKNFNSVLVPAVGVVQPSTTASTSPALNNSWTNGPVVVTLQGTEVIPLNNVSPPVPMPTVLSIDYSTTGANVPSPATGTITGPTGAVTIPGAVEGTTVLTYAATDTSSTTEAIVTSSGGMASTSLPSLTIKVDKTPPTLVCTPPAPVWQAGDVLVPCSASDNPTGSGLANPAQARFSVATSVATGAETNAAAIPAVTALDVAGNSATQGPFGPFLVDKKAPAISPITISPSSPVFGQAVTASYGCSDGGSGVVLCGPSGSSTITATANTGTLSSSADGSVGTHTFTVNARDAVGNLSAPISVSYTVSNPPQLTITPTSIAFGPVKKFGLTARIITVKNTGTAQVNFSSIKLTQTESDGGPGKELVMINLCGSKLAAGKSCYITIGFLADEVVSAAGTVTLTDDAQGSPQQVQISGTVVKGNH